MTDSQATVAVYEFDGFVLEPARRCLMRTDGDPVSVTGKPFDALVYLVERAGTLIPRQEFAEALWPTAIVEDNTLSQTVAALRRALRDSQEKPRYVATVPRRGYQFIATVKKNEVSNTSTAFSPGVVSNREHPHYAVFVTLCAAVVIAAIGLALAATRCALDDFALSPEPVARLASNGSHAVLPSSIAVLPFRSLSPDQNDAYFAAGMHEEILSRLAKVRGINVIASTSVLQYAETDIPIGRIASDLNVTMIVEGSVRYASDRVRVSVRLIDAATSAGVWSEEYDVEPPSVFDIQSDIAARIVAALEPELAPEALLSSPPQPTKSPRAYALYLRTLSLYRTHGGIGVSMPLPIRKTMLDYLDEALTLHSEFASALAWRAHLHMDSLLFDPLRDDSDWRSTRVTLVQRIDDDARRAIDLDPTQATAYATLARLDLFRFRLDEAYATLEQAIEINPNDLVVLHYKALTEFLRDEYAEAIRVARRALELDPKNPAPRTPLALALRAIGEVDAAATAYSAMIEAAPTAPIGYIALARTLTGAGDPAKVIELLRLGEQFLEDSRNFRIDAAYSYASVGAHGDAARLIAEFRRAVAGRHVDPGLEVMALLATGEHDRALEEARAALTVRNAGMDPLPFALIRQNTWSDPKLEQPEWLALRTELGFRG